MISTVEVVPNCSQSIHQRCIIKCHEAWNNRRTHITQSWRNMESSICFLLILAKENFLYYNLQNKNPLAPFQNVYLNKLVNIYNSKHSRNLSVTNKGLKHFISSSFVFLHRGKAPSFFFSSGFRNRTDWHMSLFNTKSLPFHLLNAIDVPFNQLGYQPGRLCLVACFKGVTTLRQLWKLFPYLSVFHDDRA